MIKKQSLEQYTRKVISICKDVTPEIKNDKRQFVELGWMCPSKTCDYLIKDFVELKDIEEGE